MRIAEVAEKYDISADTLRYYEHTARVASRATQHGRCA